MPDLRVIPGTQAPDTPTERVRKRLRAAKPPVLLQCPRCASREVIETRIGMVLRDGKASGGTKTRICAACVLNGHRVVVG